jgi:hypothetical protein
VLIAPLRPLFEHADGHNVLTRRLRARASRGCPQDRAQRTPVAVVEGCHGLLLDYSAPSSEGGGSVGVGFAAEVNAAPFVPCGEAEGESVLPRLILTRTAGTA